MHSYFLGEPQWFKMPLCHLNGDPYWCKHIAKGGTCKHKCTPAWIRCHMNADPKRKCREHEYAKCRRGWHLSMEEFILAASRADRDTRIGELLKPSPSKRSISKKANGSAKESAAEDNGDEKKRKRGYYPEAHDATKHKNGEDGRQKRNQRSTACWKYILVDST